MAYTAKPNWSIHRRGFNQFKLCRDLKRPTVSPYDNWPIAISGVELDEEIRNQAEVMHTDFLHCSLSDHDRVAVEIAISDLIT